MRFVTAKTRFYAHLQAPKLGSLCRDLLGCRPPHRDIRLPSLASKHFSCLYPDRATHDVRQADIHSHRIELHTTYGRLAVIHIGSSYTRRTTDRHSFTSARATHDVRQTRSQSYRIELHTTYDRPAVTHIGSSYPRRTADRQSFMSDRATCDVRQANSHSPAALIASFSIAIVVNGSISCAE